MVQQKEKSNIVKIIKSSIKFYKRKQKEPHWPVLGGSAFALPYYSKNAMRASAYSSSERWASCASGCLSPAMAIVREMTSL